MPLCVKKLHIYWCLQPFSSVFVNSQSNNLFCFFLHLDQCVVSSFSQQEIQSCCRCIQDLSIALVHTTFRSWSEKAIAVSTSAGTTAEKLGWTLSTFCCMKHALALQSRDFSKWRFIKLLLCQILASRETLELFLCWLRIDVDIFHT